MDLTEQEFTEAEARGAALRSKGYATAARYDHKANRLIVSLHNGVELTVPVHLIQDLADAVPGQLSNIEVTPSGLGLHWPDIDADVYVPGILAGTFGTKAWMASVMGEKGGRVRSEAKAKAARANGLKGGRPKLDHFASHECPECGKVFKGKGWEGIDAHWRSHHNDIMKYEDAWPLIRKGKYS